MMEAFLSLSPPLSLMPITLPFKQTRTLKASLLSVHTHYEAVHSELALGLGGSIHDSYPQFTLTAHVESWVYQCIYFLILK